METAGKLLRIKKPYLTHAQAISGHKVISEWCRLYKLTSNDIYLHSELNCKKPDPGFTWKYLQEMARIKKTEREE